MTAPAPTAEAPRKAGGIVADLRMVFAVLALVGVRRSRLVISAILSALADIAGLGVASMLLLLVRGIVGHGLGYERFLVEVSALYGLIVVKNVLEHISQTMLTLETSNATEKIRRDVLEQYFAVGKKFYDDSSTSALRDTLVQSSSTPAAMAGLFYTLLTKAISCVTVMAYLFHMSWRLTLMALAIAPLANLVVNIVVTRIRDSAKQYASARLAFSRTASEILAGMVHVHTATAERKEMTRFVEASDVERQVGFRRARLERMVTPAKEIGSTSTLLMVAWGVGLFDSGLEIAELFVFLHLVQRLMGPLSAISDARIKIASSSEDLARIEALLHIDRQYFIEAGTRAFTHLERDLEIKHLTFGYDPAAPILRDVSATIRAGKKTGIVGASGSGKSTLLNLLFRFYDAPPDTIFVDGVDVRTLEPMSWRRRVAYMSQDSFLFQASLRDNLCYGASEPISDARLADMITRLRLDAFVARHPEGLDAILGERGCRASGGERQRLALGQALLRDADILIFDEVTSALDEKLSIEIVAELGTLLAGKTVIMTSHRPALLADADQIITLAQGAVVPPKPPKAAP